MRTIATALALAGLMAAAAQAELVTERWGRSGRCRHAGAATFQPVPDNGVVVRFDLAALPEGAAIHRARLLIRRFRPVVKNAFMGLAGRDRLLTEGTSPWPCSGPGSNPSTPPTWSVAGRAGSFPTTGCG